MAGSFLFPGVRIREFDFSDYAPQLATTILGICGVANKGPLHVPTLITSESELVSTFGAPPDLSLGANERQRITVGNSASGTFTLSYDGDVSNTITPATDDGDAVKTILVASIAAFTTDNISVTGNANGPYTITFLDNLANRNVPTLVAGGTNTTVTVEVVTEGSTAPSDYGMHAALFYLRQGRQLYFTRTCQIDDSGWLATKAMTPNAGESGAIIFNAAASPDEVLQAIARTEGDWGNDIQVRFVKTAGAQNEIQTLLFATAEDAGDKFKLTYRSTATADISYSETPATLAASIKSALEALASVDEVTVTFEPSTATATAGTTFLIEFTGASVKFTNHPVMTSAVGSATAVTTAPTMGTRQDGKEIKENVYRLEVLGVIDNSGNTGVLEAFENVMLANNATLLAANDAYYLITAVNDGIRNVVGKSSYITFDATKVPDSADDIDTQLDDDGEGTTYSLSGGFSAIDCAAGTQGNYEAAYIGTEVDAVYGPTALQTFANAERVDVNLLVVSGVTDDAVLTELVRICESRADCMAILDTPRSLTHAEVVDWHNSRGVYSSSGYTPNSSYAAMYWPWPIAYDPYNRQQVTLPPSCFVPGQFAYSDFVSAPWFAAAGLVRGRVNSALGLESATPSQGALENLYSGGNVINVLMNYQRDGIVLWGNRTTQRRPTALDRTNVRRMLLYIERIIATTVRVIVFDPNDQQTWRRFTNLVDPILRQVKARRGLYDFKIIIDETTNPPELIDQNQMRGILLLKPTKTAEFITIDFTLLATGAEFALPTTV